MRRRHDPSEEQGSPAAIKLAWWAGFLATLVLVFALAQAKSAHAMGAPATGSVLTSSFSGEGDEAEGFEAEDEEEDEWEIEEECEVVGSGEDEEEVCEEVGDEDSEGAPQECLLNSAAATITTVPARDTVRLAVSYSAHSPVEVRLGYSVRGGRGPLRLDEQRARFGRQGTFRASARLGERQMARVLAAHSFTVELQAVNTPRYCQSFFKQKLTVRRAAGGGLTWSEPAARAAARGRR